ncbi:unnamed protein product [Camellia sinensis]
MKRFMNLSMVWKFLNLREKTRKKGLKKIKMRKKRKQSEVEDDLGDEVKAVSEEKDNKVKRKKKKKKKKKQNKDAKNSEENEEPTAEVSDPKDIEGDSVDEAEYYAWNELRLLPLLMKAIYSLGFKEPTPIQKACIPAAAHQGKVDFISIMLCLDHCFGKVFGKEKEKEM